MLLSEHIAQLQADLIANGDAQIYKNDDGLLETPSIVRAKVIYRRDSSGGKQIAQDYYEDCKKVLLEHYSNGPQAMWDKLDSEEKKYEWTAFNDTFIANWNRDRATYAEIVEKYESTPSSVII